MEGKYLQLLFIATAIFKGGTPQPARECSIDDRGVRRQGGGLASKLEISGIGDGVFCVAFGFKKEREELFYVGKRTHNSFILSVDTDQSRLNKKGCLFFLSRPPSPRLLTIFQTQRVMLFLFG